MRRTWLLLLVSFLQVPSVAWSQGTPVGPEFRVNTFTTGSQFSPAIAADASGFVVVWSSANQDGSSFGIFGQRYDSSGGPLGPEFRVNTFTTDSQGGASVAADALGNFVVAWDSYGQDGSEIGIFGQRYSSAGGPLGAEFRISSFTTFNQVRPTVASSASGRFVVAWQGEIEDGSLDGVFGQRYSSAGAPLGPEFRINTFTFNIQARPRVASDAAGNFVVVWQSYQDLSGYGVYGQRYSNAGSPLGSEFRVNTYTTNGQNYPSVGSDASGNFVVVWQSEGDGSGYGIFGQRYSSTGAPLGSQFQVNTVTTGFQGIPFVADDDAGNFVVVWQSYQAGLGNGVFGQRYASSGSPLGPEFRVNTYTGSQLSPAVAADPAGNFLVTWASVQPDDPSEGVFAQRYEPILPVELTGFTVK